MSKSEPLVVKNTPPILLCRAIWPDFMGSHCATPEFSTKFELAVKASYGLWIENIIHENNIEALYATTLRNIEFAFYPFNDLDYIDAVISGCGLLDMKSIDLLVMLPTIIVGALLYIQEDGMQPNEMLERLEFTLADEIDIDEAGFERGLATLLPMPKELPREEIKSLMVDYCAPMLPLLKVND